MDRASQVLTSWMAALAILMAALTPSISPALSAKAGVSWIDICTSLGAKWALPVADAADTANLAPVSDDVHPLEHCPYCSVHASAEALPAALVVLALSRSDLLPTAFLAAPRLLYAWLSAQSRAPPPFS